MRNTNFKSIILLNYAINKVLKSNYQLMKILSNNIFGVGNPYHHTYSSGMIK